MLFLFTIVTRFCPWFVLGYRSKLTENPCVPGSIPGPGINNFKRLWLFAVTAFSFGGLSVPVVYQLLGIYSSLFLSYFLL
jgi:hypothetical protein